MSSSLHRLPAASALSLALLLQACGGGASESPRATTLASVRVEGCVVDQYFVPNEGVPVRVLSADGRLLAYATSGRMGEFSVQVPAGVSAAMKVDRSDGETMTTPALDRDRVVDACLVARN